MTLLVLVKGKDFSLSPQMFEPERSQVEAEKLVKGLEFIKQNMCTSKTNTSYKQRLVHLNTMTEKEILCPREHNKISDELLKGLFCFFNDC